MTGRGKHRASRARAVQTAAVWVVLIGCSWAAAAVVGIAVWRVCLMLAR